MTLIERWILVGLGLGGAFAMGYGTRSYEQQHREPPHVAVAALPPGGWTSPPPAPSTTIPLYESRERKIEPPKVEAKKEELKKEYTRPSMEAKWDEPKVEYNPPPRAVSPTPSLQFPLQFLEPTRKEERKAEDRLPFPRTVQPAANLAIPPQVTSLDRALESPLTLPPLSFQSREPDLLIQPVKNVKSTGEIPVDPNGMDFQLIKNQLNIKTTILDEAKPVGDLPVLKSGISTFPFGLLVPAAIPLLKADPTILDPFFELE